MSDQAVSGDAWFKVFQDRELVFLFQGMTEAANRSSFFRLDVPEREERRRRARGAFRRAAHRSSTAEPRQQPPACSCDELAGD